MHRPVLFVCGILVPFFLAAQETRKELPPIQDNLFLLEEAYNQEDGVVQHINTFMRNTKTRDWMYTFTQEWPAPIQKHQLSFTAPFQRLQASPDGRNGLGDVALNYRYQLLGDGDAPVAIAPRFSLLLPTGDERQMRGNGALGYQVNLPISIAMGASLVTHFNAGATWIPKAKNEAGAQADLSGVNLGQALVWLARPTFNALVEVTYSRMDQVAGPGQTSRQSTFYVNPGLRWAINFRNGLQIVPGIAAPIGIGPSRGDRALFFYLSLEHPLWKP